MFEGLEATPKPQLPELIAGCEDKGRKIFHFDKTSLTREAEKMFQPCTIRNTSFQYATK